MFVVRPPGDHRVTFAVVAAAATRLPGCTNSPTRQLWAERKFVQY
ncbi:hypothetical protein MMMB2_2184 [Mycobacterium marinum MB2]|nr:hypothetical protein MMMB2_2184 [Mycobacterium marinum MB2]